MGKLITLIASCVAVASCDALASAPNGDLFSVYPEAKNELVALASCRAYYVGQHYHDPLPSGEISEKSSGSCHSELQAFLSKIGKPDGDATFVVQLDQIITAKIERLRMNGLPVGPGPKWAGCVTSHLDVSHLQRERLQGSLHDIFAAAYRECRSDEETFSKTIADKVGPSSAAEVVTGMKKSLEEKFYDNLLQAAR